MKAISADPKSIGQLFAETQYVIPEFQRPYAWDKAACERLWEDLIAFYDKWSVCQDREREQYFLGTIVVYPESREDLPRGLDISNRYAVIDGQQRLTTLALLAAAFASRAGTFKRLRSLLRVRDSNDEVTDMLRVQTRVLEDDPDELSEIILAEHPDGIVAKKLSRGEVSRKNNFVYFRNAIDEWCARNDPDGDRLENLIEMFLKNVVVLPIHCGTQEDAFLIFEVVNNRGKPLSESDIFKSHLLKGLGTAGECVLSDRQKSFLAKWKTWCDAGCEDFLFRVLMRIKNGEMGNVDTTDVSVRTYFLEAHKEYLKDADCLIADLGKLFSISQWERPAEVDVIWAILERYPNEAWKWPLYAYLFKNGTMDAEGDFVLPEACLDPFISFSREVLRYVYGKGLIERGTLNNLRGESYRQCARVFAPEKFDQGLELDQAEREQLSAWIAALPETPCYQSGFQMGSGLVLLCSYLRCTHSVIMLSQFLSGGRFDVEHICPKCFANADGWTLSEHAKLVNTLGNLIPLEKAINISVSDSCFQRKQGKLGSLGKRNAVAYKFSESPEARELAKLEQSKWLPDDVRKRTEEKMVALREFFNV